MKSLEYLDGWIANKIRAWSARIPGTPKSQELLEIRRDILNDVREHIQPRGEGKTLFPYNVIAIEMAAENSSRRAVLGQAFGQDNDLEQTISALLQEARCPQPANLQLTVTVTEDADVAASGRLFRIDYSSVKAATAPTAASITARPPAKLTVVRGEADEPEYRIDADRVNIGRLKEVVSDKDGLRRRNHVSFGETETTVSREHAFIRYDSDTGKFRLYDSMSARGTIVFRDGRRFEVPKGPAHGFQLRSGDEIHLGTARLRFEIEAPGP